MSEPAGLPPIPSTVPLASPGIPGGYQPVPRPQAPAGNPVGRPSLDPAAQEARVQRTAAERRLEGLSPNRAKDDKLHIFKLDPATGRSRGKPVLTLLSSHVESALNGVAPDQSDDVLDELVLNKLPETAPAGLYKCQWYDKTNKPVANPPAWELQVGEPGEEEEVEGEEVDDTPDYGTMPVQTSFPPPAPLPPAPAPLDLAAVGGALRAERQEESKRSNETMTLMMTMQQASQQQMAVMMQMQQSQQQAAQALAAQAEERDRQRRAEFRTTLMTMIPLVLPVIQQLFMPKDKAASAEMTILLELVKGSLTNKGSDAVMFENMMKLNGEMTRQAMQLQASGASTSAQMQAEATSLVFKNLMTTLKETMDMKTQPKVEEESTLSSIAKIAGPIIAAVQQQQQAQPAAAPDAPQPAAPAAPAQPRRPSVKQPAPEVAANPASAPAADAQAPARRRVQRPERPKKDPATYTDVKRIEGTLLLARKLSLGIVRPNERWNAIKWIVEWMPPAMLDAVKAKNEEAVMQAGMGAALGNATILQWITDEENQGFLRDVIEDVRLLVSGEATEKLAEASVIKSGIFVQRRLQAQQAREQADEAALAKHTNPDDLPPQKPPVAATLATDVTSAIAPPADATIAPPAQPAPPAGAKIPPPSPI